jgi:hypothetical protein
MLKPKKVIQKGKEYKENRSSRRINRILQKPISSSPMIFTQSIPERKEARKLSPVFNCQRQTMSRRQRRERPETEPQEREAGDRAAKRESMTTSLPPERDDDERDDIKATILRKAGDRTAKKPKNEERDRRPTVILNRARPKPDDRTKTGSKTKAKHRRHKTSPTKQQRRHEPKVNANIQPKINGASRVRRRKLSPKAEAESEGGSRVRRRKPGSKAQAESEGASQVRRRKPSPKALAESEVN